MLLNILFVLAVIWLSISITSALYSAYWLYNWYTSDTLVSDALSADFIRGRESLETETQSFLTELDDDSSDIPF